MSRVHRYLFLDCDGVIAREHLKSIPDRPGDPTFDGLDPNCVSVLVQALQQMLQGIPRGATNEVKEKESASMEPCRVVLSSSWRRHAEGRAAVEELLQAHSLPPLYGVTPVLNSRPLEIIQFLRNEIAGLSNEGGTESRSETNSRARHELETPPEVGTTGAPILKVAEGEEDLLALCRRKGVELRVVVLDDFDLLAAARMVVAVGPPRSAPGASTSVNYQRYLSEAEFALLKQAHIRPSTSFGLQPNHLEKILTTLLHSESQFK
jgi:hypothetical protein